MDRRTSGANVQRILDSGSWRRKGRSVMLRQANLHQASEEKFRQPNVINT
jgi:hypothetical protein